MGIAEQMNMVARSRNLSVNRDQVLALIKEKAENGGTSISVKVPKSQFKGLYHFLQKEGFNVGHSMQSEGSVDVGLFISWYHIEGAEEVPVKELNSIKIAGYTVDLFLCDSGVLGITVYEADKDPKEDGTACVDIFVSRDTSTVSSV